MNNQAGIHFSYPHSANAQQRIGKHQHTVNSPQYLQTQNPGYIGQQVNWQEQSDNQELNSQQQFCNQSQIPYQQIHNQGLHGHQQVYNRELAQHQISNQSFHEYQQVINQGLHGQQHSSGHQKNQQPSSEYDKSWPGKIYRNVEKVFNHYDRHSQIGYLVGDQIFRGYKSLTILMRVHYKHAEDFWTADSKVDRKQLEEVFTKLHNQSDCHNIVTMAPQNCSGW